jgi:hypothetical protein
MILSPAIAGLLFLSPLIKYKGSKTNFYDFKPRNSRAFVCIRGQFS